MNLRLLITLLFLTSYHTMWGAAAVSVSGTKSGTTVTVTTPSGTLILPPTTKVPNLGAFTPAVSGGADLGSALLKFNDGYFAGSVTTDVGVVYGSNGVGIAPTGVNGELSWLGLAGQSEQLTWDLGGTANTCAVTSLTGLNVFTFAGMSINAGGFNGTVGATTPAAGTFTSLAATSPAFTTSVTTPSTTFAMYNTTATTVNAFGVTTTLNIGAGAATVLNFGGHTSSAELRFLEPSGSGTNYSSFKVAAQAANLAYTLPATAPTDGQYLSSLANGTMSWGTPAGTGDVVGPGSATDNAIVRFDNTTGKLVQNSAVTVADTTGTITTPGAIITGSGGATAGFLQLGQGTAPSAGTTAVTLYAPTSVTSYTMRYPGAAGSGLLQWTNTAGDMVGTLSTLTSGRVTFATTNGLLADDSDMTFATDTLTVTKLGATTLTGTIAGGGQQLNNIIIGTTTPLAGTFTTLTAGSTTSLLLGTAGSAVGNIGFRNATSGTATVAPPTGALGTYTVTLPNAASTLPVYGQQITYAGPTAARTVTYPDASITVARTDAANTFTGVQTMTSPVFVTKAQLPTAAGASTLATGGDTAYDTTNKKLGIYNGTKEVAISTIYHQAWSFDPKAVCDGAVDRLFLMSTDISEPFGIHVIKWKLSFEADPTTEIDLDLKRADAFIGVANAAVMDVLDTTSGASSEATSSNINSDAVVVNAKVLYLEFGTAYTETTHQCIFEMWWEVEED